jgi:enamine deaminase RidA (YjgF/YER057c/UK114 family)
VNHVLKGLSRQNYFSKLLDDVVRVRYILPDRALWAACWPLVSAAFAVARPAATMIVAGLQEAGMKIEIEVTARLPTPHIP